MSRTSALTRKPKDLGRRNFAQGYPRSHATPTPTSRSKGQKSRWGGGILWRRLSSTACYCPRSIVFINVRLWVCLQVDTITFEPFEISSWNFYGSKIWPKARTSWNILTGNSQVMRPSRLQCRNRPIFLFRSNSNFDLKPFTVFADIVAWSDIFQRLTTLSEKWRRTSQLQRCLTSLSDWPRVLLSVFNSKNLVNGMGERFFAILKTSMRSERFLLSSRDHWFNLARRSMYMAALQCDLTYLTFEFNWRSILVEALLWKDVKYTGRGI